MTDGLGRRVDATDAATGELVEHLELATELVLHTEFASALTDRVTRLSAVRHASYVRLRRVDRPAIDRLVVVSDATPGPRLSDLLVASAAAGARPELETVVSLLRQLLPAAALFSRNNRAQAIGTIAPERIFLVAPARVVIADAAFGTAIDQLMLSRTDAWRRYRVAAAPSDDAVTSSPRGDATALGIVALSMLHGRLLSAEEFPDALPGLVSTAQERHGGEDHPLSGVFSRWLRRALQMEGAGFDSPQAAQIAFEEVLASNRRYVTGTGALEAWMLQNGARSELVVAGSDSGLAATPPAAGPVEVPPGGHGRPPRRADVADDKAEGSPPAHLTVVPTSRSGGALGWLGGLRSRWAAVIVAVVLLQAAVIGWYWTRPAPGPSAGQGELVVSSRPVGARVIVNGTDKGVTPLTVTLPAGPHVIEVRAGSGEPRVIPLVIRANVQTAQYVELQEALPAPPLTAPPPPSGGRR